MNFLKSFFHNFLVLYFALHLLPGLDVMEIKKLPHVGSDLIFSAVLGLLNALILYALKLFQGRSSLARLGLIALGMNLVAFAVLKFFPLGIRVASVEGYLFGSVTGAIGAFVTNYFELKRTGGSASLGDNL